MTVFDVVFLAVAVLGLIIGLCRGLMKSLLDFVGFIISAGVAILLCVPLGKVFNSVFNDNFGIFGVLIAFLVVFFIIFGLVILAKWGIERSLIKHKDFRVVDVLVGPVFHLDIIWLIFGLVFAFAELAPTSGMAVSESVYSFLSDIQNGVVLRTVYGSFNPMYGVIAALLP